MVRIAHCTDFSKNAKKALEAILFSFWSFDISMDVYHLAEGDYEEAAQNLASYKTELLNVHGTRVAFKMHLYEASQKASLMKDLNEQCYYGNIVGLEGSGESAGIGSFLSELYKSYQRSMTIIPYSHEIKIENKVFLAVEYKRLEELYILVKFRGFLNFQFAKLIVLVRTECALSPAQVLEIETILRKILPSLKIKLEICNPESCTDFIENEIKEKNLDYYILFKDDYFDKCIYGLILSKPSGNTYRERVIRISSSKEELDVLKNNQDSSDYLSLRS